jgi:hypothetical protein
MAQSPKAGNLRNNLAVWDRMPVSDKTSIRLDWLPFLPSRRERDRGWSFQRLAVGQLFRQSPQSLVQTVQVSLLLLLLESLLA